MSEQLALFDYASLDDDTAEFVREKTDSIRAAAKRTVESVLAIGRDLTEVKERLGHGRFLGWLEVEFGWTVRTAQNLMNVWESFKCESLSHLEPIDVWALYRLAAPSTPPEVREAAIDLGREGQRVTKAQVEAGRKVASPAKSPQPSPPAAPSGPVATLVQAGSKVAAGLPPDSDAAEVKRAIKDAMREAAGVKKPPSPKEADKLATETGKMVWGSDNRWHDGTPDPSPDEEAEHQALSQFQVAIHQLEQQRIAPERIAVLTQAWDVPNWLDRLPSVIGYLRRVLAAIEAADAAQEERDAA